MEEEDKKVKDSKNRSLLIVGIIVFVALNILLIYIKTINDKFTWFWFILFEGLVIFLSFVIIFAGKIPGWFGTIFSTDKVGLPPAITPEQGKEILKLKFMSDDYMNEFGDIEYEQPETHGKRSQSIYCIKCKGFFPDEDNKISDYFLAINLNYPERITIKKNASVVTIAEAKRKLVVGDPDDVPDTEETTTENAVQGIKQTTKKTIHKKKEDIKNQEESDI